MMHQRFRCKLKTQLDRDNYREQFIALFDRKMAHGTTNRNRPGRPGYSNPDRSGRVRRAAPAARGHVDRGSSFPGVKSNTYEPGYLQT
jgi:hypothetical protein